MESKENEKKSIAIHAKTPTKHATTEFVLRYLMPQHRIASERKS